MSIVTYRRGPKPRVYSFLPQVYSGVKMGGGGDTYSLSAGAFTPLFSWLLGHNRCDLKRDERFTTVFLAKLAENAYRISPGVGRR